MNRLPSPQPAPVTGYTLTGDARAGIQAFEVAGPCMSPEFNPGDIVLFRPQMEVPLGHPCLVKIRDWPLMFRRVYQQGQSLTLTAVNVAYEPLGFQAHEVESLLAATQHVRAVK